MFADVLSDECLDANCFHTKVAAFVDRQTAANPELVQIENGYCSPKEKKPGAVQRGRFRELAINPDVERVPPCAAARPAIIVFGKRIGTTLTVCTDADCPIHVPRGEARREAGPAPALPPATEAETEKQTEERRQNHEQQRKGYEAEQERQAERRRLEYNRQQQEYEAAIAEKEETRKVRAATLDRILANALATFTARQLRVLLRGLVNLDPYTFADDVADHFAGEDENRDQPAEGVLLDIIDGLADEKLTCLALRLAFTGHVAIPRQSEIDFLAEANAAFAVTESKPKPTKKVKKPSPIKQPSRKLGTKNKKKVAA